MAAVTPEAEQMRLCGWCHEPMNDTTRRRRKDAVTCSSRCRKALSRDTKQARSGNSVRARRATPGDVPYDEPPRPGASFYQASLGDERFHRQRAQEDTRAIPLTDYERILLDRQRRNPGPLIPELAKIQLDRAIEQQRREAEEHGRHDPIKVQDQFDPGTRDHVARRGLLSRNRQSKPADPNLRVLRPPGQSGHGPRAGEAECIQAPWSRSRW